MGSWMVRLSRCYVSQRQSRMRGITSKAPLIVSGQTGNWSSSASMNAPLLNTPMWPVKVRAPSGNTTSDMPSWSTSRALVVGLADLARAALIDVDVVGCLASLAHEGYLAQSLFHHPLEVAAQEAVDDEDVKRSLGGC